MSILSTQRWKAALIAGSGFFAAALQALTLSPVNMSQHFVEPGKEVSFAFTAKDAEGAEELSCEILNYRGAKSGALILKVGTDGTFTGNYSFPEGYFVLSVSSAKQQFGFVALPDFKEQKDYFWGANVVQRLHSKLPYVDLPELFRIMERTGVKSFRKWHSWELEERKPGKWSSREEAGYDFVRKSSLSGLWYCNRYPKFLLYPDRPGQRRPAMPESIIRTAHSLAGQLARRRDVLDIYQLRNEPDGQPEPSSVYSSDFILKSSMARRIAPDLLISSCGFMYPPDKWEFVLRDMIENGLLETVDYVAFHNYAAPDTVWKQIREWRNLFGEYGKAGFPLLITECGKAWPRGYTPTLADGVYYGPFGNKRPPLADDLVSAHFITAKAVLAKAAGIERFYVFVFAPHPENTSNYGLLDYYNTPIGAMGAYMYAARVLSGLKYVGDVKESPRGLERIAVFSDGTRHVAVLLAKDAAARKVRTPGLDVSEYRSMDGSAADAETAVTGIAYRILNTLPELNTETEGMKLQALSSEYKRSRPAARDVIIKFEGQNLPSVWQSYMKYPSKLVFRIANISETEKIFEPELLLPEGIVCKKSPGNRFVLKPDSEILIAYETEVTGKLKSSEFCVTLRDKTETAHSLKLRFTSSVPGSIVRFPDDAARWIPHCEGGSGFIRISNDETEKAVRFSIDSSALGRPLKWVEPGLKLVPGETLVDAKYIIFEVKVRPSSPQDRKLVSYAGAAIASTELKKHLFEAYRPLPTEEWSRKVVPVNRSVKDLSNFDLIRIGLGPVTEKYDYWIRNVQVQY